MQVLREDLYFEYTMAYAIRGWPLMEYFNRVAMAITEHGLLHHWESEVREPECADLRLY